MLTMKCNKKKHKNKNNNNNNEKNNNNNPTLNQSIQSKMMRYDLILMARSAKFIKDEVDDHNEQHTVLLGHLMMPLSIESCDKHYKISTIVINVRESRRMMKMEHKCEVQITILCMCE